MHDSASGSPAIDSHKSKRWWNSKEGYVDPHGCMRVLYFFINRPWSSSKCQYFFKHISL